MNIEILYQTLDDINRLEDVVLEQYCAHTITKAQKELILADLRANYQSVQQAIAKQLRERNNVEANG